MATPVLPSAGASLSPPPPSPAPSTTAAAQPQASSSASSAAADGARGLGGISALSAGSFGPDPSTDPKNGKLSWPTCAHKYREQHYGQLTQSVGLSSCGWCCACDSFSHIISNVC